MLCSEWQIDRMEPWDRERLVCLEGRLFAIKMISYLTVLSRAFIRQIILATVQQR